MFEIPIALLALNAHMGPPSSDLPPHTLDGYEMQQLQIYSYLLVNKLCFHLSAPEECRKKLDFFFA